MSQKSSSTSVHVRKKTFAIKKDEGQALSRRDIQYDFLHSIFFDAQRVFTNPFATSESDAKVTFRDLYVQALVQSPRCSRALKDKLQDMPEFGTDFAMISLLANVGRVNTTMTFLPEMKTSLRTYHPVPALQRNDENLQDAPRIKNLLKACALKTETGRMPVTQADLLALAAKGTIPTSSIVNVLFVLSNNFTSVAHDHFGRLDIDLLDFFLPIHVSSVSRAQAFLWLVYRYHQGPPTSDPADPNTNPFDDDHSRQHPGMVPKLVTLNDAEFEAENVDTPEENEYGARMNKFRLNFIAKNAEGGSGKNSAGGSARASISGLAAVASGEVVDIDGPAEGEEQTKEKEPALGPEKGKKGLGKGRKPDWYYENANAAAGPSGSASSPLAPGPSAVPKGRARGKGKAKTKEISASAVPGDASKTKKRGRETFIPMNEAMSADSLSRNTTMSNLDPPSAFDRDSQRRRLTSWQRTTEAEIPPRMSLVSGQNPSHLHSYSQTHQQYQHVQTRSPRHAYARSGYATPRYRASEPNLRYTLSHDRDGPQRTSIEHALHTIEHVDPLADSDDEGIDHQSRAEYITRLGVLQHLQSQLAPGPTLTPPEVGIRNGSRHGPY